MKRKVEVFTANCPVCDPVVQIVQETGCDNCEITIYNVVTQCESGECLEKIEKYGVTRIPAVAVDGRLLDCCKDKGITKEDLQNAGIGS